MSQGLKITFIVHALVALVFGIVLFFVPNVFNTTFDWSPFDPTIARLYGAVLLAISLSSWLGYRATRWEEVRIVVSMEIALAVLGALAGLYEVLLADGPTFTWVPIVVFVVFGVAWIYFYRQKK